MNFNKNKPILHSSTTSPELC